MSPIAAFKTGRRFIGHLLPEPPDFPYYNTSVLSHPAEGRHSAGDSPAEMGVAIMMVPATMPAALLSDSGRSAWLVGALVLMGCLTSALAPHLLLPRAA
jgi:hypothetical protein